MATKVIVFNFSRCHATSNNHMNANTTNTSITNNNEGAFNAFESALMKCIITNNNENECTLHVQKCTTQRLKHHSALAVMDTSFISKSFSKQIFEAGSWESGSVSTACNIIFAPF